MVMKRWMFFMIAAVFAAMPALALAQGAVELPKTGQKQCYDAAGNNVIDCATQGQTQDGAVQAGVAWPVPRFTGNGDGTVTDNLTGLMWLKNANCFGAKTWAQALTDANDLAHGTCGLIDGSSAGDWRLPNIVELESLVHSGYNEEDCSGSPCGTNAAWLNTQGFENVQSVYYWSGTSCAGFTGSAWVVDVCGGYVVAYGKSRLSYVWPVRAGQ
jgi:hypothetical protein